MNTEFEATFINTDHQTIRDTLQKVGATLETPEYTMRRIIFDYPDLRLDKKAAWIRLRQEDARTTLTYKQRNNETIEGMQEIEVVVDNFTGAADFLKAIGLSVKSQQESKREIWRLGECEIMLDTWPWIPPFIEVEGPSEAQVKAVSEQLGQAWDTAMFDSIDGVYMKYYDVTRTEISTCKIAFEPIPKWLAAKQHQPT